jgi:DNA invertase Pin-like site-specific DNA recombinase
MSIRTAIYARSSLDCEQSTDEQVHQLKAIAERNGWTVVRVFADQRTIIKKGRERRTGEAALRNAIRRGEFEKLMVWSLDRLGQSLPDLVGFLQECHTAGISLYAHEQKLDTAASNGLSLFDISGMLAHYMRQARRDRILRGQAAARNLNVKFGRPPLSVTKVQKAKRFLAAGKGVRQAARLAGISAASASRLKNLVAPT